MMQVAIARELPPRLELDCLKALWILGEASVRDVQQLLEAERPLAYTTVMTILDRLSRRGCVARRKDGRSYLYAPILTRDNVLRIAVRELVDRYFDGCEDSLRTYLSVP